MLNYRIDMESRISVFAILTFDTDYLLVKTADPSRAIGALQQHGFPLR
jgi:hypothetical protein